jgi:hypothetical protein
MQVDYFANNMVDDMAINNLVVQVDEFSNNLVDDSEACAGRIPTSIASSSVKVREGLEISEKSFKKE